ncbi:MAG: ATP-binding cassette domain-containing protein [Candidatus Latescibacteria bacterium]|nr:ATP-binding cassette domain-containing protein [bacterium]MBD3423337.1 ATP-binding cassette domain-containing protein [Candidatus Latescibacterota bacterium]
MEIEIRELSKVYGGKHRALHDIDLEIESGIFGLLGPNGAGKTTLMRILVTLMEPTSGEITIGGHDLRTDRKQIREMIGYLPQEFKNFPKLKTWEFLDYAAGLAGIRDKKKRTVAVDEMLEQVGLFDVRERRASKLSGGMKRRLGIAQALIGEPGILVVDEPTTGLDPEERVSFRNLLSDMSEGETIIILSTHIVGDISSTCRRLALLNEGELVYSGTPEGLVDMARGHTWKVSAVDSELEKLKAEYPVISTFPAENGWEVHLIAEDIDGFDREELEPGLEHAYVYFMENRVGADGITLDNH